MPMDFGKLGRPNGNALRGRRRRCLLTTMGLGPGPAARLRDFRR